MDANYGLTALPFWEFGQSQTQLYPLGARAKFYNPSYGNSEFIYCVFTSTIAFGALVKFDQNFLVSAVASGGLTIGQPVYVNTNTRRSFPVGTTYGWVCSHGFCVVIGIDALSVNGSLYLSGTAGKASNAGSASNRLGNFQIVQASTETFSYDLMIEKNAKIFITPTMNRLIPQLTVSCPQMTLTNAAVQLGQTGNVFDVVDGVGNETGKFAATFSHNNASTTNFAVIFNNGMSQK